MGYSIFVGTTVDLNGEACCVSFHRRRVLVRVERSHMWVSRHFYLVQYQPSTASPPSCPCARGYNTTGRSRNGTHNPCRHSCDNKLILPTLICCIIPCQKFRNTFATPSFCRCSEALTPSSSWAAQRRGRLETKTSRGERAVLLFNIPGTVAQGRPKIRVLIGS